MQSRVWFRFPRSRNSGLLENQLSGHPRIEDPLDNKTRTYHATNITHFCCAIKHLNASPIFAGNVVRPRKPREIGDQSSRSAWTVPHQKDLGTKYSNKGPSPISVSTCMVALVYCCAASVSKIFVSIKIFTQTSKDSFSSSNSEDGDAEGGRVRSPCIEVLTLIALLWHPNMGFAKQRMQ